MKASTKDLVATFVATIGKNLMGGQIVYRGVEKDLKKGTAKNRTSAYTKFFDEKKGVWGVEKETTYSNITFQRDYQSAVENRADNKEPYNVEKPKGMTWVEGLEGIILVSDKDPNKFYLRIAENKNTTRKTTYFIGDRQATESELEIIKENLPTKSHICKKQIEYGVSEENLVIVKSIALENIKSIKFGDKLLILK